MSASIGMFNTCTDIWENDHIVYKSDSSDIFNCCLKNCTKPLNFCLNYCNDNNGIGKKYDTQTKFNKCHEKCEEIPGMCLDTCRLTSPYWGPHNPYLTCMKNFGCNIDEDYNIPNTYCLNKNEQDIMQCCIDNCTPASDLDCEKHCQLSKNISLKPYKKISSLKDIKQTTYNLPKNYTWIYIISTVIIATLITIIILKLITK